MYEERAARTVAKEVRRAKAAAEDAGKEFKDPHARKAARDARAGLTFQGLPEEVCPVVFLYPTRKKAVGMRDRLRAAIAAGELPRYSALDRELRRHKRLLGRMFLFAGWDELVPRVVEREAFEAGEVVVVEGPEDHGHSLKRVYAPLSDYVPGDGGGAGVDLRTVAECRKNLVRKDGPSPGGGSPGPTA